MTSTNRVVANALVSLEELLKKQGLSRAEFDKMMKEMKDKGASAVHYMRGKDGRLLFKADGTTIGNAISEKAVNGEEVENTRTLPVSKQAWTECELKGIEAMKKYLASHKGVLPRTIKEVDDVLGIIPDIDVAEKQNVMSYFKYGRGKSLVANSMKDDVAEVAKMVGRSLTPNEERSARILLEAGEPASRIARSIQAMAPNAATNAKFKVGDKVQRGNQIGVVKDIEKEPYIEVKFKDEPITLFVHERELKISNSRAANAKFKVGDKVYFYGRPATVKQVIREPDADYILDVQGDDWYAEDDEVTSRNSRACNSTNAIVHKAMNACAVNGPTKDEATAKRDIEQSLRKMADFATKFTGAKTTPSSALNDPMYSGYIELTFPTEEESANFNPYYLINKLGDDKSLLPRWAWGIYGFNYNRNGQTWRIKIGRFAT